jgi:hypothetical protein
MATLELLLAVAFAAALADLLATRGYAAVAAATVFLAGLLGGAWPSTPFLKHNEFAAFVAAVYLAIVVYSHFYMREAERLGWFWGWMGVFFGSMELFPPGRPLGPPGVGVGRPRHRQLGAYLDLPRRG